MAARKKATSRKTTKSTATKGTKKKAMATKRKPAAKSKMATKKKATKAPATKAKASRATVAKKSASVTPIKKAAPIKVGKKAYSKSEFMSCVAEQTGLSKKDISSVLEAMSNIINVHLKKQGPEMFSMPGLFKIVVVNKPATPARWGVNPFTGEKMKFQAKPASRRVKIRPLKGLKEMAAKAA